MKQKLNTIDQKDHVATLVLLVLGVWFALFFIHEQQFTNLDQAKLVRYGEVIWEQKSVSSLQTCFHTHTRIIPSLIIIGEQALFFTPCINGLAGLAYSPSWGCC